MNIPPKYEDVVAKLEAERELHKIATETLGQFADENQKLHADLAALREELESIKASVDGYDSPEHAAQVADEMGHQCNTLQQRLTVAEQRYDSLRSAAQRYLDFRHAGDCGQGYQFTGVHPQTELKAALKPAAEGEGS